MAKNTLTPLSSFLNTSREFFLLKTKGDISSSKSLDFDHTLSLCLSHTVCCCHRQSLFEQIFYVSHTLFFVCKCLLDHSWLHFYLFIRNLHPNLSVSFYFVLEPTLWTTALNHIMFSSTFFFLVRLFFLP